MDLAEAKRDLQPPEQVQSREVKKCRACSQVRPFSEFYTGYATCRDCELEKRRQRNATPEARERKRSSDAKWRASEKGKNTIREWNHSESGRLAREKYQNTDKHTEKIRRRYQSEASRQVLKRFSNKKRGAVVSTLTAPEWREILERFEHACAYCAATSVRLDQDHVIPISRGGNHTADNVVPACLSCNSRKSNRTPEEFGILPMPPSMRI